MMKLISDNNVLQSELEKAIIEFDEFYWQLLGQVLIINAMISYYNISQKLNV